jgi:cobalamin biosynthesis Mg chelatase CobN
VNGDDSGDLTKPASCQASAVSSSAPGSYVTSCSGVDDANYSVVYSSGVAIVDAAPLTAAVSSASTTGDTETTAVADETGGDTSSSGTGHSGSTTASGSSGGARPTTPATGGSFELLGSNPMLTIGLILVLVVLVGGGVLFFVRRRN